MCSNGRKPFQQVWPAKQHEGNFQVAVLFDKLADPILQASYDYWEVKDRFQKLAAILPMAVAVIQDAEERQARDDVVRVWLLQFKNVTCKVEDLVEEFLARRKVTGMTYTMNFSKSRKVLDDLHRTLKDGLNLQLTKRTCVDRKFDKRETSSFGSGSKIYGREEDRRKVVEKLLSPGNFTEGESLPVVSIVGAPGIGKSTLAQMVYNDDEVKQHFKLRIWVFVSSDFEGKRIIKAAIESVTGRRCDLEELDVLQLKLWNTLSEKKFLLVLDNIWSDDHDEWDKLRPFFTCGSDGSKILITTRSEKTAILTGSPDPAYRLEALQEEDIWAIFRDRAFVSHHEEENSPNLVNIGIEIARNCHGVPLAAKVLGGVMRFKKEETDWLHVQNSDIWALREYKAKIFPVLHVTYLQLSPHLKHCFVFCSVFPKGHEFMRTTIIQMWIAQGYIFSNEESRALEDIGDEYFNELLWVSVLKETQKCEGGSKRMYKMNELFYSLAHCIGKNEFLVLEEGVAQNSLEQVRHLSIVPRYNHNLLFTAESSRHHSEHLRTLLLFSEGGLPSVPIFSRYRYLRELKLSGCHNELPESIGGMILLRYLDLSYSHFHRLPQSISGLCSLEVLNLFGCYNLYHLPHRLSMPTMRHLDISGCEALQMMPCDIGQMIRLKTLPIYIIPRKHGKHVRRRSIYELQQLDLRGELKIKHVERVCDINEAKAANLMNKSHLKSLGLCWGQEGAQAIMNPALGVNAPRFEEPKPDTPEPSDFNDPESCPTTISDLHLSGEILEVLQPHVNLNNLFIVGYPGIRFPNWNLPNLVKVVLINCTRCIYLPLLGHLPVLKSLHMERMLAIASIGQEFYGQDVEVPFPLLEELFMDDFPRLQEWSSLDGKDIFPKLIKVIIKNCPNLVCVPLFMSLKHLELQYCNSEILNCMEEVSGLSTLVIRGFNELVSLPERLLRGKFNLECLEISSCPKLVSLSSEFNGLTSLRSLTIRWCTDLPVLPQGFQNLSALETLEISDCHSLNALPDHVIGHLTSLQTLSIETCSNLTSITFGEENLTSLEHLRIMHCPNLASFPDNSEKLTSLKSLSIISCPLIISLPQGMKHASALRTLEIHSCHRIKDLPEWLDTFVSLRSLVISDCQNMKILPVAVARLRRLQLLSIEGCPDLHRRCQQEQGEDWWKITHIPHRRIHSSQRH